MASTSSFAPPKLADFILTERLGSGTYATVYKAYRKVILWCSQAETSEKSRNVSYCYCKFSLVFVQTESESWSSVYDCDTAGRQQRGGGGEGGCEKESKQGIHRKPAHGDWNAQDDPSPSYSPAKRLPGKLIYSFWICGSELKKKKKASSVWLLIFPWVSECLSFISGMLRIFIWSWSGVLVEICPASSAAAGFCLSGWPDASCNRWVSHYKLVLLIFFFSFSREFQHFSRAKQTWTLSGKTCRTHFYGRKTYTFFCHLNLVVCVSVQTACALQFLHERNISHLDLKPQNILLSGSVLKLAGDHMPTSSQTIKQMRMNFACGWDHICIMPDIFKCHVSFTPICFRTKKLCLNMKL